MSLGQRVNAVVPPSQQNIPTPARAAVVPGVVLLVVLGIWVTGGVVTDDAGAAKVLTGAWLAAAGCAALVAGLRWRSLAVPVIATYAVTASAAGGYLLYASEVDRVVNENVVVAAAAPRAGSAATGEIIVRGAFESRAHETTGTATILDRPDGTRVLTLTDFRTDPGPDLRVYLVPGDGSSTRGAVDLGGLKGNRGNQQYDVPPDAAAGAVIIWCRAFSVSFAAADLT